MTTYITSGQTSRSYIIKAPASGLEPEHQKNLITQRLAISCLTKLGLYRHIVGGEGLEPPMPKPRIYSPLHYQFCSSTYKRRTQDLNLQASKGQLFSRQLPHHPDIRHVFLLYIILYKSVTYGNRTHIFRSTI